jgi:hypothetical protein
MMVICVGGRMCRVLRIRGSSLVAVVRGLAFQSMMDCYCDDGYATEYDCLTQVGLMRVGR